MKKPLSSIIMLSEQTLPSPSRQASSLSRHSDWQFNFSELISFIIVNIKPGVVIAINVKGTVEMKFPQLHSDNYHEYHDYK